MKKTLLVLGMALLIVSMSLVPALAADVSVSGTVQWEAQLDLEEQPWESGDSMTGPTFAGTIPELYNVMTTFPLQVYLNLDVTEADSAVVAHIPLWFGMEFPLLSWDSVLDEDSSDGAPIYNWAPFKPSDKIGYGLRYDSSAYIVYDTQPLKVSFAYNALKEAANLGFEPYNDPLGLVAEVDHDFLKDNPIKQLYVFKANGGVGDMTFNAQVIQPAYFYHEKYPSYIFLKGSTYVGSAMVTAIYGDRWWIHYHDPAVKGYADKGVTEPFSYPRHHYNLSVDVNYSPINLGGVMIAQVAQSQRRLDDSAKDRQAMAYKFKWSDLMYGPFDVTLDFTLVDPIFDPVAAKAGFGLWESEAMVYRGQAQFLAKGVHEFGDEVVKKTLTATNIYRVNSDGSWAFAEIYDVVQMNNGFYVPYNETKADLKIEKAADFLTYNLGVAFRKVLPGNDPEDPDQGVFKDFNDDYRFWSYAEAIYEGDYKLTGRVDVVKEDKFFTPDKNTKTEADGMGVKLTAQVSKEFAGILAGLKVTNKFTYQNGTYDFFGDQKDKFNGANSPSAHAFFGGPGPTKAGAVIERLDHLFDVGYTKELDDTGSKFEFRTVLDRKDVFNPERKGLDALAGQVKFKRDLIGVWGKLTYNLTENLETMVSAYYGNTHKPAFTMNAEQNKPEENFKQVGYATLKYKFSDTSNLLVGYSVTNYESVYGDASQMSFGYENWLRDEYLGNAFAEYSVEIGTSSVKIGWSKNRLGQRVGFPSSSDPYEETGNDWQYPWGEISSMRGGRTDFGQWWIKLTTNF